MTWSIFATFDKCPTIKFAMTIAAGSKEDGEGDDRMHASWRTVHRSSAQQPTMQTNLGQNRLGQLYSLLISVIFYPLDRIVLRL